MNFSGNIPISGWSYSTFSNDSVSLFDRLLEIFKELLTYTSGDFDEAVDWLRQLDKEYSLTTEDYTIDDFIDELLNKGFISTEINTTANQNCRRFFRLELKGGSRESPVGVVRLVGDLLVKLIR